MHAIATLATVVDSPRPPAARGVAAQAFFTHWVAQRSADDGRYELVEGRVERRRASGPRADAVSQRLHRRLARAAARHGAFMLAPRQHIELPTGDTLAPDIVLFGAEPRRVRRVVGMTHPLQLATRTCVPELVVDVLADSPARRDRCGRVERWRILARAGVREHWLVDPRTRTVTVLVRRGDRFALHAVLRSHEAIDAEALLGIRLPLALVF